MKNKNRNFILFLLGILAIFFAYLWWKSEVNSGGFECRAKMHINMTVNICDRGYSDFDIFLSMQDNGLGYYMVLGTYTCPNSPPKFVDSTFHFAYEQNGQYYTLYLDKRDPEVSTMVKIFKYDELKIKIKKVDSFEYIVYLPFEQPMICKQD
ncbi:Uncharacterised protein [Serratia quinivorans]|uniref:Uncharacterized protein n=2 Tax=Serratia TaxID=613 RepID=A0A379ZXJ8_9GAMM|nr:hypothetical protein BSR03_08310 [Serratia proteamaculans]CAI1888630.1 Uncharacterised protein [Serratia quinivorans]SUI70121.1 Uncharacterised protein [Serratia quinivorans]